MKLTRLTLRNYRGLQELIIEPAPSFTLVVAMNGVGKTTLAEGLAAALGGLLCGTLGRPSKDALGRLVCESDHRRVWPSAHLPEAPEKVLSVTAEATWLDLKFSWEISSGRGIGARGATNEVSLHTNESMSLLRERLEAVAREEAPLPLFVVLPAGRAPRVDLARFELPRASATESESPERLVRWADDPTLEVQWEKIRDRWYEIEQRSNFDGTRARMASSSIVAALTRALPLDEPPAFNADYADFMVKLPADGWRPVSFMSDGWRTYVGSVVALAIRCAALNPWHSDAAAITPGVLVVDELEQHLHPQLQLVVVDGLRSAFPELQIVATTHSPLVVTDVRAAESDRVLRLERRPDDTIRMESLAAPVGCNAEEVLTGAWFGLASTLDDDTLRLLAKHRALMRKDPDEREARKALEEELRRRLRRFAETSVEEFVLAVVAELEAEPMFEQLSHAEMRDLRARVIARIREDMR